MNRWIVDRIEEGLAVLENIANLESIVCPVADLPKGIQEGDPLIKEGSSFLLDSSEEAAARSSRMKEKFERLKKKG